MEQQRFAFDDLISDADDPLLQGQLAKFHERGQRPRCLCMPKGVPMYVARHQSFLVKRMPGTGSQHHPDCPSYELPAQQSGLAELAGEAILENEPDHVELRVDFPWIRKAAGGNVGADERTPSGIVSQAKRRMSLRALTHFLFERAGFNRWTPAMEGKRNQGVVRKYLMEAAQGITVHAGALGDRLYVPEPFSEAAMAANASRRRERLALLHPQGEGRPLAVIIGDLKSAEAAPSGWRIWLKHMPDCPLWVASKTWARVERQHASLFEARVADTEHRLRIVLTALIKERREHLYEIDTVSLMLASAQWIPLEGVHEVVLLDTLITQRRRFIKPLRYDAPSAAAFANFLLLDTDSPPTPLHILSPYASQREQALKAQLVAQADGSAWVWRTGDPVAAFPRQRRAGEGGMHAKPEA